jgi:hypothetical protein
MVGAYVWQRQLHRPGQMVYLEGTVTKYDPSPAAYDGLIIFQVDGRPVDIGGGLRPADVPSGSVYKPIAVGDRVTAKLTYSESGMLTVYACAACYVKKQP